MLRSIQEFLRKINSTLTERLTFIDFMAIIGTILIISGLFIFITLRDLSNRKEITYTESNYSSSTDGSLTEKNNTLIVASKNGSTYFYSWCKGVERIKPANIITFNTEKDATDSGRRKSSTCK